MSHPITHGADGPRVYPPRGRLSPETATELKAAVAADPRSVPTVAAEVGVSQRHLYNLMAGLRLPSRDVAQRLSTVLDLHESLASTLLAESSPGVAR